jgi:hypothetical protein
LELARSLAATSVIWEGRFKSTKHRESGLNNYSLYRIIERSDCTPAYSLSPLSLKTRS